MRPRLQALRRLGRDERAAFSILTAGVVFLLFGLTAAVVDLGSAYWQRRVLQAAADAAAAAGSFDLSRATAIATEAAAANGVSADAIITAVPGTYTGDPSLAPTSRFAPGGASPNALKVTINATTPLYFLGLFLGRDTLPITVSATAANIPAGAFSAGTGLASLDNGILNSLLGGMLGGSVALSLADYQTLATTNVSLLNFADALASQIGVSSGTYGALLSDTVTFGDLLAAAASVAGSDNDAAAVAALTALDTSAAAEDTIPLGDLLDLGAWDDRQIGALNGTIETAPGVNLLDLVMFGSQVAAGGHLVTVALPVSLSGIAAASLSIAQGEPDESAPRIGLGPVGISVHTAQTRLYFTFTLLPILGGAVQLPLYLEAAEGTASLSAISCGSDPANDAVMTITGAPGLATADIAGVSAGQMTDFTAPVTPGPATILDVAGLAKVTADVTASLAAPTPSTVDFSNQDIDDATVKSLSSTDATSGLLASLANGLGQPGGLTVTALGLGIGLGSLGSTVASELQATLGLLDPLVTTVLSALGIELGTLDLRATGMRCGIPVIVQ